MTDREIMKLALEALENHSGNYKLSKAECVKHEIVITAIKEALAQPEQKPVAWESLLGAVARGWCYEENANKTMDSDLAVAIAKEVQALYTTPPQRTWVGLTDEEIEMIVENKRAAHWEFVRQVEAKLKEKNT